MTSNASLPSTRSNQFISAFYATSKRRARIFKSKPKACYIAVSCDIYILPRNNRVANSFSDGSLSFMDFRGAQRYDLLCGSTSVELGVDGNKCALRVISSSASTANAKASSPAVTIICNSSGEMVELSDLINLTTKSFQSLKEMFLVRRRQSEDELQELRTVLDNLGLHRQVGEGHHMGSANFSAVVSQMTASSQASKGTFRALQNAKKWARSISEAVADSRGVISVLENVFAALPIAGPITQVLGMAADVAVLTKERTDMEAGMKDIVPRCQAVAKDVVQALFFSMDYTAVEDTIVDRLFVAFQKSCHVARSAERFVMQSTILQFLSVEDVSGIVSDVKEIESLVTSLRILQYAQENHARNKRLEEAQEIIMNQAIKEAFRPALIVPPVVASASMSFEELAGTPESDLNRKLFDDRSTSGLLALVGMTGVGKTAILSSIVSEPKVRKYFDGGIYEMRIGGKRTFGELKLELSKVVKRSGGKLTSEKVAASNSLQDALDLARDWFFGHRCLFLWDNIESSSEVPDGYILELRTILDLVVGSRGLFSTRDRKLASDMASPRDIVDVLPRSYEVSEKIFLSHASVLISEVAASSNCHGSPTFRNSISKVVEACNGLPLHLAVAGKAISLTCSENVNPPTSCQRLAADEKHLIRFRDEALTTSFTSTYAGFEATVCHDLERCSQLLSNHFEFAAAKDLYNGFCVINKDCWTSATIAKRLWALTLDETISILSFMRRYHLVETREQDGNVEFRIHGLFHAYCEKQSIADPKRTPSSWHRQLLTSYESNTAEEGRTWWDCEALGDGYLRQNLMRHLTSGNLEKELVNLLLDFRWIKRRLEISERLVGNELSYLEMDYRIMQTTPIQTNRSGFFSIAQFTVKDFAHTLSLISSAIRLARSNILCHPVEYGYQICGRIAHVENLNSLKLFLKSWKKHTKRPTASSIRQSLTPAGGALQQSIHIGWIILSVACVPNSELVLAGGHRGAILVNLEKGSIEEVLCAVEAGKEAIQSVAVNERGSHGICGWTDGTVDLWDLKSSKPQRVATYNFPGSSVLTFTKDGNEIVVGFEDGDVLLTDVRTGRPARDAYRGHSNRVTCVAASSNNELIASGSHDHTVRIWKRAGTDAPVVITLQNRWIRCIAWTPDMKRILAGTEQNDIWVCDLEGVKQPIAIKTRSWINSLHVTKNSKVMISACHDCSVQIWDLSTNEELGESLRGHIELVTCISVDSEETKIVSSSYDKTLKEWTLRPNTVQNSGHARTVSCLAMHSQSNVVASGSYDRKTKLWDLNTGEGLCEGKLAGPNSPVRSIVFSPDGSRLACGYGSGEIALWDSTSGELIRGVFKGHRMAVRSLTFSSGGDFLASGGEDKIIRTWNVIDKHENEAKLSLEGHKNWISCICYSEDQHFIVSGSFDRTLRIWSTATGKCITQTSSKPYIPRRVTFFENDANVIATLSDSKSRAWLLLEEGISKKFVEYNLERHDGEDEPNRLLMNFESPAIRIPSSPEVLAHLDHEASCEALYDGKHHRLWAGLRDGTVAAIELLG